MKALILFLSVLFTLNLPKKVKFFYHLPYIIFLFHLNYPNDILVGFLYCLFLQDLQTMYISKRWILPSLIVAGLLLYPYWNISSSIIAIFAFALPISIMYVCKRNWMGSADICFIYYFCILLGYQRMSIALLCSTCIALIFCLLFQKKEVPFLCFLSIGVIISVICGYQIWYQIFYFMMEVF